MEMFVLGSIVGALVGGFVAWHLKAVFMLANIAKNPDRMIKVLNDVKELNEREAAGEIDPEIPDGIELRIEKVGAMMYAYDVADGTFIAQGPDLNVVLNEAHARFPGHKFFGKIATSDSTKQLV